jgi:glutaredoxin 2
LQSGIENYIKKKENNSDFHHHFENLSKLTEEINQCLQLKKAP